MVSAEKGLKPQVVFRADASASIGSGHVMRCLTLADALRGEGAECHFICREAEGNMLGYIAERGYSAHGLPVDISPHEDAAQTAEIIKVISPQASAAPYLVVDHYGLAKTWQQTLRPHTGGIMVIDDLADRPHDCDILLDQNMVENFESRYKTLVPEGCMTLLGPQYALLRPEFAALRAKSKGGTFPPEHIFVNFGGGDQLGMTLRTLMALAHAKFRGTLTVVAGHQNPDGAAIKTLCANRPNTNYYPATDKMAALMAAADLAIGAGGSTTWERMCLGVPTLTVVTAPNQLEIAKCLGKQGLIYYAGQAESLDEQTLGEKIKHVFSDRRVFLDMRDKAQELVDGKGTIKLASEVHKVAKCPAMF